MNVSKLVGLLTPLVGVAGIGAIFILYGFVNMKRENNILQFLFGIPIMIGALGLHFLIRKLARQNPLHIWIAETIIVAYMCYLFQRS